MLRHRKLLLALTLCIAGGSFYAAFGYAVYLHSDWYRAAKQRELVTFLQLPATIGDVKPQDYYRADFHDIHVWLLGRRAEIFQCQVAEMHEIPRSKGAFGLVIRNGRLTVDAELWGRGDYDYVLRSGLGHDFEALKLRWVNLVDVDLAWRQGPVAFTVKDATGPIKFLNPEEGRISVISHTINGTQTSEPINVVAKFKPARDLVVHEVVIRVPPLPIRTLLSESLSGVGKARGKFEGKLSYYHNNDKPYIRLKGRAEDVHLEDWTTELDTGLIRGRVDLQIDRLELNERGVADAKFSGRVTDLRLSDAARFIGAPPIEGVAELEVRSAEVVDKRLVRMSLNGEVVDGSLDPIVAFVGPGKIAGTFRMKVNSLDLADDQVVSADIDVEIVPPEEGPATLDTALIEHAAGKLMGIELSSLVVATLRRLETVTYSRFAFKLLADNGQLRVLGTHGPGKRVILTVKVLGTDLPVVTQPENPVELAPIIAMLRTSSKRKVHELLKRYQVTTAPAGEILPKQ